ncbi:Subtilisin-like protease SBT1.7 [Camellia lanceoleosa]|uniref:Subtilisin-like protease SBT1.7 n=1 Tax=Camellia lanceoleosa TaxID=1840588 RepID=A0ACC0F330_9ERIC|nr:Subtilisin-like protease SBT1.7 [Camellia lanceoleosa]
MNKLHTTRSWEFLGIDSINQYNYLPMDTKSNVIVAMIDTGVWPESKSFNDEDLGPVPPKFKGECTIGKFHIFKKYYSVLFKHHLTNIKPQNGMDETDIVSSVSGFYLSNIDTYDVLVRITYSNTLDPTLIRGKIVVCGLESFTDDRSAKAVVIRQGGGVGMILIDPLVKHVSFQYVIPATAIGQEEAQQLQAYMTTEKNPIATIKLTSTVLFTKPAPQLAVFSSMGPNIITPYPTPGLNILAAWSPVSTTTTGGRNVDFNIISGTSMSCPHVSAVAAIIKSVHPSWSPAAIKSAIMTTATILDNTGKLIERDLQGGTPTTPFDYGSGHINPVAAVDPGLIYDFDSNDIIDFLCSTGSTPSQMVYLTGVVVCCKNPPTPSYDFNYPSIGISNMSGSLSVHRTVTYYGKGSTVYYSQVDYPSGVKVKVTPNKLEFSQPGEKMSFRIDMTPYKSSNGSFVFGALTWSNGVHRVRSPIAINVLSV